MKTKKVNFYSGPGLKLAGTLCLPDEVRSKLPAVVLCHGPGGYRDLEAVARDTLMPNVSKWLTGLGYATLIFSYRGVGESEGPEFRLIPLEQVEDIRNAVTFVEQQPEVDVSRLGLFGAATGGAHVGYVAGIDPRIKCVVGINSMGDTGRWMRWLRRYWEYKEFLKALDEDRVNRVLTGKSRLVETKDIIVRDPETQHYVDSAPPPNAGAKEPLRVLSLESAEAIAGYQPESVVDRISPRAAMWVVAEKDTLVPVEESQSLYEKAREPKKLVVVAGAVHHGLYHSPDFDKVMEAATGWYERHLKGAGGLSRPELSLRHA